MHQLDADGAFADSGRHALHRTVSDVAGSEHSRDARLERKRKPSQHRIGAQVLLWNIVISENEPIVIQSNALDPVAARNGANETEAATTGSLLPVSCSSVAEGHDLQHLGTGELHNLCLAMDLDLRVSEHAVNQVAGHPSRDIAATDHQTYLLLTAGQK